MWEQGSVELHARRRNETELRSHTKGLQLTFDRWHTDSITALSGYESCGRIVTSYSTSIYIYTQKEFHSLLIPKQAKGFLKKKEC